MENTSFKGTPKQHLKKWLEQNSEKYSLTERLYCQNLGRDLEELEMLLVDKFPYDLVV